MIGCTIKMDEMGLVCGTCAGVQESVEGFGRETCREGTTWKTRSRWEVNIKVDVKRKAWDLGEDRDRPLCSQQ